MKLQAIPKRFETGRLVLRPFAAPDRDAYAAYHSRPEVYRYLYMATPPGRALDEQFGAVLTAPFEGDGDVLRRAVVRKEDDAVLGEVLFKLASLDALQGEVGYIFNPDFAGRGYASEAVAAMLKLGFEAIGFHRIFARLDAANEGFRRCRRTARLPARGPSHPERPLRRPMGRRVCLRPARERVGRALRLIECVRLRRGGVDGRAGAAAPASGRRSGARAGHDGRRRRRCRPGSR